MRNQNGFMRELDYVTYLPYVVAGDLERSRKYVGTEDTLMFVYHAADTIEVWKHDNVTPGGVLIASTTGAGAGSFFNNNMAVLAGTTLTVTQVNGNAVSVDLASLIPADVKLVGLAVAGDIVTATMSDGATIPLDLSSLTGNSLVNLQMVGSDLIATAKDGTLITIPLGALADGGVTAFALTADTLTLTRMDGTLFNVDLAKYQETLTKMSAYIWTFDNGEGGTTTIDVNLSKLSGDFPAASYLGNRGTLENLLVAIDAELEDHDARLTLLENKQDVYVTSMSTIQSSTDGSNSVITLNMSNGTTHSITTQDADKDTTLTTGSMVGNTLHLGNGAGTVVTIDLTPVDTENASMNMNGDILQLTDTDGNVVSVDLSQFMDDTDTNVTNATFVLSGNVLTMTESNGNSVSVDLSVLANDTTVTNASMGLNGNVLQLTDTNGQVVAVDLSPIVGPDTNTKIASYAVSGSTLIITDTDGGTFSVPLSPVVASLNSANGVVSHALVGTTLRLTLLDGTIHNVDLSSLATVDTNTINQSLSLVGNTLRVTDSAGGIVSVSLAGFMDDTDVSAARISYNQASRTLTVGVTEDGVEVTDTQVLPLATETAAGLVELATQAETGANGASGTDAVRVVTPDTLAGARDYSTYPDTADGADHVASVQEASGNKRNLRSGPGYREHAATNLMSQFFTANFSGLAAEVYHDFVLPYPVTNAGNLRCQMTDAIYNAAGANFSNSEATASYSMNSSRNTATTVSLGWRTNGGGANPFGVMVYIPNART